MTDRAAGDKEAEGVNRIGRAGREDDIARRGDGLGEIGEAFLGTQRDDHFAVRIEIHVEASLVIARLRLAQSGNAAGGRILVGARFLRRLLELVENVRRGRQIGISHPEIDDIRTICPQFSLQAIHFFEYIRRQALGAVKFHRRTR